MAGTHRSGGWISELERIYEIFTESQYCRNISNLRSQPVVALLTGRVFIRTASGAPGCPRFVCRLRLMGCASRFPRGGSVALIRCERRYFFSAFLLDVSALLSFFSSFFPLVSLLVPESPFDEPVLVPEEDFFA
jgi:hypothetical protein